MHFKFVGMTLAALMGAILAAGSATAAPSHTIFAFSPAGNQELHLTTDSGSVVIQASKTGWYQDTGLHDASNSNYLTGFCGSSDSCLGIDRDYRSFFAFDLSNVSGSILSASLSIGNPTDGFISTEASLILNIFEVVTSFDEVVASHFDAVDIFADLGDGTLFGSYTATSADNGTHVPIDLNSAALMALNEAIGSNIIFGGAVGPQGVTNVPAPASLALLGLGLLGLHMSNRRRRA